MSIIITGLKMPTERESFNLTIKYNGVVLDTETGMQIAEAYELPQHGRLGDLDKLAKKIEHDRYNHTHTDGLAGRHHIAEYGHFLKEITNTPTIIEAEENNNV